MSMLGGTPLRTQSWACSSTTGQTTYKNAPTHLFIPISTYFFPLEWEYFANQGTFWGPKVSVADCSISEAHTAFLRRGPLDML